MYVKTMKEGRAEMEKRGYKFLDLGFCGDGPLGSREYWDKPGTKLPATISFLYKGCVALSFFE